MIGNSRLHWGLFNGQTLDNAWDTEHCEAGQEQFPSPLVVASVVPEQTARWENYPDVRIITLDQLPLEGLYPTLGIDRALALLGSGETLGFPVLVMDAGTALTFTGMDEYRRLVGGAILPGLGLQLQSLGQKTAALPAVKLPEQIPSRWARSTPEAIQGGVVYTILSGIQDFVQAWWQEFPGSAIALTGGDRTFVFHYLQSLFPQLAAKITVDPHLIFWGMRSLRMSNFPKSLS